VRDQESITTAMAVPLVIRNGTLGMVYVDRGQRASRLRTQDLDMLSTISTHMTAKLNDLLSGEAQRSAQTTAAEIGVVHAIQEHLDPKAAHNYQGLQVAAYSRAGQENPGDVYDVMQHPDTGVTAFMLGHVNGGGALLALSMARLQSTFRVGFLHNDPPHALARALNWLMFSEQDPTCVDALFFLVDPKSGKFRYARAGKIGGFIVDPNGQPRALENATAPSIGEVANFPYPTVSGQFLPGETLAMYTRGTATCTSADGQRFGEHRFIEAVCDGFGQSPTTTLQDLTCELTAFFDGGTQPDDISIVLIHREA
jgi:serine phosphatase RsbU (regulator of sigma subunit)